ncbi:asparagine synthetase domain-containing protein CG17486 [Trichonephila clavata]|uniref:Asparagine synthetase domain-containing protein CG17486 n=1 Tax=Trichonephila clavata TaxID=2740835 RepID=A0A8X6JCF6_TRICU|nr:asparagine synthetase domain-containing protein CG17486 [Trichonephila clavata]
MCGILLTEINEDDMGMITELIKNRGRDCFCVKQYKNFLLCSSVLSIRGCVSQPIENQNFILMYNGEVYNNVESDTLFIKEIIDDSLKKINIPLISSKIQDLEKNTKITISEYNLSLEQVKELVYLIYNRINEFENEMSIVVCIDDYILFFKDDIGRKSLGLGKNKFFISSVKYDIEIDSSFLYIYRISSREFFRFKKNSELLKIFESRSKHIENILKNHKDDYNFLINHNKGEYSRNDTCSFYKNFINVQHSTNLKHEEECSPNSKDNDFKCSFALNKNPSIAFNFKGDDKSVNIFLKNLGNETKQSISHEDLKSISILDFLLKKAVKKRLIDEDLIVFFSGGIDSVLITLYLHLTQNKERQIYLINTAFEGSFDRKNGKLAYLALKQKFSARKFVFIENNLCTEQIVKDKEIISNLISPKKGKMDFNLGVILFYSSKCASKFGKISYLGSGADELFCGYNKYKNNGEFRSAMFFDLYTISYHNISRDDRIISNNNIEARLPFLDTEIIKFTLDLADSAFIFDEENKILLRRLLRFYGLEAISHVPKKAMQYGTGIFKYEKEIHK